MPSEIKILDVKISPPRASNKVLSKVPTRKFIDIEITIKSMSESKTLYVISRLRSIGFDERTNTLMLMLSEPKPIPGIICPRLIPPSQVPVAPGETRTLKLEVPLVMNRIILPHEPSREKPEVKTLDISNLQKVQTIVEYSDTQFHVKPGVSGEKMSEQLRAWGKTVEETLEIKIPEQDSNNKSQIGG